MANPTSQKDNRIRLGPLASELVHDAPDSASKVARLEAFVAESKLLKSQMMAGKQTNTGDTETRLVLHQLSLSLHAVSESLGSHTLLTQERFRRLETMHLTTRALVGLKLSAGSEKEQLLEQADALLGKIQAYTDTLELTDQQKQQARENEVARMQQLLTEAGSYHQEQDHQMEQDEQNMGGQER